MNEHCGAVDGNQPSTAPCYWFVFRQDNVLLQRDFGGGVKVPLSVSPPATLKPGGTIHDVGAISGYRCLAASAGADEAVPGYVYLPLRQSYAYLPYAFYGKAGKSHEILYWDLHTQYCGVCGEPMQLRTPISKCCPQCGAEAWPSLSVAIIVLIEKNDEVLLVQSRSFRGNYYGLVSGYVETGETLEQCVHREVLEETALTIADLRYVGSQVWPFPCTLMVAYRARYAGGCLQIQRDELRHGEWFRWNALPALPGEDSIARKMVEAWAHEQSAKYAL